MVEVVHVQGEVPHTAQHVTLQQSLQDPESESSHCQDLTWRQYSQDPPVVPVVQVQRGPQLIAPPDVLHQTEIDDQQLLDVQLTVVPGHGVLQHGGGQRDGNLAEQGLLHLDLDLCLAEDGETELVTDLDPAPEIIKI